MKILVRVVLMVMGLVVAGLAFIYFVPGYNLLMVRSESMVPFLNIGDLVVTGPMNGPFKGEISPGTIVTYQYRNELVTHRVKQIDGNVLVTQGDATEDPDPWQVTIDDVRGVFLFKIPSVGYVTRFVQTKTGWFLTIIVPGALLVLWLVKDIVKEALRSEA